VEQQRYPSEKSEVKKTITVNSSLYKVFSCGVLWFGKNLRDDSIEPQWRKDRQASQS